MQKAEIGIFGGSGFYQFGDQVEEIWVNTPYGAPSDKIAITTIHGRKVAFLPRHGKDHHIPPSKINYRANLWAMKSLGVTQVIGPCAAGSLKKEIKPGDFVVVDQFVNRTWGREDTFFAGPQVTHVSAADPYCPVMRQVAIDACKAEGISVHEKGTVVVIQGPRFSTRAESKEYQRNNWDVINMTQYPEGYLARELEMCYVNIALVTDYDAGLDDDPSIPPVVHEEVLRVFAQNIEGLRKVLFHCIKNLPKERVQCACGQAVHGAQG
ncbi:MAG TPA: S-methyl-5'-thioadenosine phosphorylase [Firmicutes bacterium]|jgi:5'-methylthioadenosine phosphorylase|nr:S-methyl-5'-thioadenosine phosphorylase [Bacillota bacterium]